MGRLKKDLEQDNVIKISLVSTLSISDSMNLEHLSHDSSFTFRLQLSLIFCLSMYPVSASSGLWSNIPSKTIKSEKSVLHLILHSFSMHLQSLIVFVSFSLLNLFVFTQKRLQTIIRMNDNIHMDSTIARSTIYPFTLLLEKIQNSWKLYTLKGISFVTTSFVTTRNLYLKFHFWER